MIGFVILLGLVVNNAILLVYRARDAEREGMSRRDAVESAVRLRLTAHPDEHGDQHFRHVAADVDAGRRHGVVPGNGDGNRGWYAGQHPVYPGPPAQPFENE